MQQMLHQEVAVDREHKTIFNAIVFENIFPPERDINNGRVYKC